MKKIKQHITNFFTKGHLRSLEAKNKQTESINPEPGTLNFPFHPLIQFLKPLGFHDYNHLQKNAKAVLSDSGTISKESSIMNFPAINIRDAHERPEAMEEAALMMVGLNTERIMQGLAIWETQQRDDKRSLRLVSDYSMPNVSDKVVRIILSYTDYVNHTVWNK